MIAVEIYFSNVPRPHPARPAAPPGTKCRTREILSLIALTSSVLVVAIGAAALFIGAVGLAGVLAHQVATRTRELSIRAALGATRRQIAGGVVRGALTVAILGASTGLVAAFVLAHWLSAVVTGVDVHDPIAFLAAPLVLLIVVVVASVAPARRAAAIDPAKTLRA